MSCLGGEFHEVAVVGHGAGLAAFRFDYGFGEFSVGVVDVDNEVAARTQSVDMAVFPCRGEGGEELQLAGVALWRKSSATPAVPPKLPSIWNGG